ncbi:hypothetical protein [Streptomyces sp. NPDC007100]|uniref:hypothetical protein n=1 Tax=Streptomyces sp. NPDC007100 TaxID=3155602 RepID=UPI0033C3295E
MLNETSLLTSCLARLEWSPERLAREINKHCGSGTISSKAPYNWLKGARPRRQLPYLVAQIVSERLGESVTVEALWPQHFSSTPRPEPAAATIAEPGAPGTPAADPDPVAVALDWMLADEQEPPSQQRGEEVNPAAVEMLFARVRQLRELDDSSGTPLAMDWASQDLQWVRKLVAKHSYDAPTGAQLHRVIAELCQFIGWLTADMGMVRPSRSCFVEGLRAARLANDRSLAAYIISCMSYRAAWDGRGTEALRLIGIARRGAGHGTGIVEALLATRQARAYACLRDETACHRALDEAADLSESAPSSLDSPWAYWLTPAVMVADAGRAWLELGRPKRAERELARGIDLLGTSQPRNTLLHLTSLAEARLKLRELDGATAAATHALSLAEEVTSLRAQVRLSTLRRLFSRYDSAEIRQVVQRADDLLGCCSVP